MDMKFADWLKGLNETGTGTDSVAVFARPVMGMNRRQSPADVWGEKDPFFRKKRVHGEASEHPGRRHPNPPARGPAA
jgi:hypothetical protein